MWGAASAALGLRVGAPVVLGAFGAAVANCGHDSEDFCPIGQVATGVLIGAALAVVLDATTLAYDSKRSESEDAPAPRLTPSFALGPHGGSLLLRGSL